MKHSINELINKSMLKYNLDILAYKKYGFNIKLELNLGDMKKRYDDDASGLIETDILDNIISNAIWAITGINKPGEKIKKGKGKVSVKTYEKNKNDYVEIEDTGIGINKENLENLFKDGFTTKQSQGHGLYYAIKTIKRFEGTINVHTEEGKGTKFTIIIPHSH